MGAHGALEGSPKHCSWVAFEEALSLPCLEGTLKIDDSGELILHRLRVATPTPTPTIQAG